jgi:cell division protein FtsN
LNGLSADVVKTVEGGQTWYRVISGPYDSSEAAIIAQQTLQRSGIDSIVVKR